MMAELANSNASVAAAGPVRPDWTDADRAGGGNPFEALLATAQSGYGAHLSTLAGVLHHDIELSGPDDPDSHRTRLQVLANRADERDGGEVGLRRSDLDPTSAGRETLKDKLTTQARAHNVESQTRTSSTLVRPPVPSIGIGSAGSAATESRVPDAATQRASDPPREVSGQESNQTQAKLTAAAFDKTAVSTETRTGPVNPASAVGQAQQSQVAGPVRTADSLQGVERASAARQIAQLLGGRSTGVESARAVTGAEQTAGARSPESATTRHGESQRPGSAAASEKETAAGEKAQQSDSARKAAFENLVRSIRMNVGRQQSSARLRLNPPELGHVRIDARMNGQNLELFVQAETATARRLLEGRAGELLTALEQHGVKLERFELVTAVATNDTGGSIGREADAGFSGGYARYGDQTDPQSFGRKDEAEGLEQDSTGTADELTSVAPLTAAAETRLDLRI